jgi:hypothetical protein
MHVVACVTCNTGSLWLVWMCCSDTVGRCCFGSHSRHMEVHAVCLLQFPLVIIMKDSLWCHTTVKGTSVLVMSHVVVARKAEEW